MPCFRPMTAYPAAPDAANKAFVFSPQKSYAGAKAIYFPCGKCDGCLKVKADAWGVRAVHELQMHQGIGCFLTLTYDEDHLPRDGALEPEELKLFLLRVTRHTGKRAVYICCGEYGDAGKRPHYHAILFGVDFSADRYLWQRTDSGSLIYRSPTLERLWPYGFSSIGEANAASAAYLARYTMKSAAAKEAAKFDRKTGEVRLVPQFFRVSNGIGRRWFDKFSSDVFPCDFVVLDGRKVAVPPYYKVLLRARDQKANLRIDAKRKAAARLHAADKTDSRLAEREEVARLRSKRLVRSVDGGDIS
jgi:hypothetical protein